MPLTVPPVASEVAGRIGARMAFVGLSLDPSSARLRASIAWAATRCGGTNATPGTVVDADLAGVSDFWLLCDLSELRMTEEVVGNFAEYTTSVQSRSDSITDLLKSLEARRDQLREQYRAYITPNRGGVIAGTVVFPLPTPRSPRWAWGWGRTDH